MVLNECYIIAIILQVRWADIEEKRTQDKMRAIGFVVGQNWNRVMDPSSGRNALTQIKFIDRN